MFSVYIIYSETIDRYYIGESNDIKERLLQHKTGFYDSAFTKQVNDWSLFHIIECDSRSQARKIESHIKKMKSKKYIENLKMFPEIASKLKNKYK